MNEKEVLIENVWPADEANRQLVQNVHPADWTNPEPAERYNLVVIGAGTAGLVSAAGAAGLGAKVALIERHLMGGDCLNIGCVPSKAIIRSGHAAADIRKALQFGVDAGTPKVDFAAVMQRVREVRAGISPNDSAQRFRDLGVDVFLDPAGGRFTGPDTIEVDGQTLRFAKAVIATGARAAVPPIPGLAETGYLTNETVFNLTEQPARMAFIGGGPIGCELAQAFARLGTKVTLIERGAQFLEREDPDAAAILKAELERDGVHILLDAEIGKVSATEGGKQLEVIAAGGRHKLEVDEIMVGAGRIPNVEGLGLEAAGVEYDTRSGVKVDDRLCTSNKRVFAAGDVAMKHKFTHAADAAARIVIANALFKSRQKVSDLTIPWCTYTEPEIAHVGLYAHEAEARGIAVETYTQEMSDMDRAIAEGQTEGFVKVHVEQGSDKILGATVVARHAGEMISELTLALTQGIGLGKIASVIHPYPTQAEAIKRVADAYNRTRLTPGIKKWFERWMKWTR